MTARLVLVASRIDGHADVRIADELGGPLVADALAASLERNRDDDALTDALREAVEEVTGIAAVTAAAGRAWNQYKAGNDDRGEAA